MNLNTPLSRVTGLGSAKEGVHHWIAQRLTAIALVPLLLWFVYALICIAGADYADAVAWVSSPLNTAMLVLLVIAMFYHGTLGIQVIIEDYVHQKCTKIGALVTLKLAMFAIATAAILAILRIALGAA